MLVSSFRSSFIYLFAYLKIKSKIYIRTFRKVAATVGRKSSPFLINSFKLLLAFEL
jgi:hypothetical protein